MSRLEDLRIAIKSIHRLAELIEADIKKEAGMNGKSWTFQIVVPQESAAGIRGLTDKVQIVVESGDPGGELGEFAYFMEGCLREWFDTVEVTCYNLSGEEATHER